MNLQHITTCRGCGNPHLADRLLLGNHYLHGNFYNPNKEVKPPLRKIPVDLVQCDVTKDGNACGLVQLAHTVPPEVLYYDYGYRSNRTKKMVDQLKSIVDEILFIKKDLKYGSAVLDVGMNDGTLLKQYPSYIKKFGVDGGSIVDEVKDDSITAIKDFFPSHSLDGFKFEVLSAIACLYDINNIYYFIDSVYNHLTEDGIFVFEVAYLPTILKHQDYSHLCHEHLTTFHLAPLEHILGNHGLKIFKAKLTDTNNGSILCFCCKGNKFNSFTTKQYENDLKKIRFSEFESAIDIGEPFYKFRKDYKEHTSKLFNLVKSIVECKQTIHILGSSTKGNVVLQSCGIDSNLIQYAAEKSPEKWGCKTLGTNIQIISEEASRAMNPDYYLCLIPQFKAEVMEREKEFFERGGKMIFPFPAPIEIISKTERVIV